MISILTMNQLIQLSLQHIVADEDIIEILCNEAEALYMEVAFVLHIDIVCDRT